jgi:hypothetical protein
MTERRLDKERSAIILDKSRHNTHEHVFFTWLSRLQQRRFHRACLHHFRRKFLGGFFKKLTAYTAKQRSKHLHVMQLRDGLDTIRRRQALLKFKWITHSMTLLRNASLQADFYHSRFMFRASVAAWFHFYRSRQRLIHKWLYKQKQTRTRIKKKILS